jgi:hypothetical protein
MMKFVFFHNWFYSSAESGKKYATEAIEAIKQNLDSFPFRENDYEIASAEAKAYSENYWLLLFLVSSGLPTDDSLAIRQSIEAWLETISVSHNNDRTVMTARFDTLQECLDKSYPGAYTLHTVIRSGKIVDQ